MDLASDVDIGTVVLVPDVVGACVFCAVDIADAFWRVVCLLRQLILHVVV